MKEESTFTPESLLFRNLTFEPEASSNHLRTTFITHNFSTLASSIKTASSTKFKWDTITSDLPSPISKPPKRQEILFGSLNQPVPQPLEEKGMEPTNIHALDPTNVYLFSGTSINQKQINLEYAHDLIKALLSTYFFVCIVACMQSLVAGLSIFNFLSF